MGRCLSSRIDVPSTRTENPLRIELPLDRRHHTPRIAQGAPGVNRASQVRRRAQEDSVPVTRLHVLPQGLNDLSHRCRLPFEPQVQDADPGATGHLPAH